MAGVPRFKGASGKGAEGGIGKSIRKLFTSDEKSGTPAENLMTTSGAVAAGYKMGKAFKGDKAAAATKSPDVSVGAKPFGVKKSRQSPVGPMGSGITSGTGPKTSPSYKKSQKAAGDAYLASSSTDYGVGSAVNSFVNKPKKR